uniref:AMP-binding domain-containing protein n=2 Tax=Mesocestoides corti TaxID=53468 RepID=A0A5K3FZN3_MESCO
VLREKLLPILQERQIDLSSERDQSRTFVAAYLTTGFNRVVMQLACMRLRLAYIPMDSNLSAERLRAICKSLSPVAFISDDEAVDFDPGHGLAFAFSHLLNLTTDSACCCVSTEPLFT